MQPIANAEVTEWKNRFLSTLSPPPPTADNSEVKIIK